MAKILVQINESSTDAVSQGNISERMISYSREGESLWYKTTLGDFRKILSDIALNEDDGSVLGLDSNESIFSGVTNVKQALEVLAQSISGGSVQWGSIIGNIANQTDLTLDNVANNGDTTTQTITAGALISTSFIESDGEIRSVNGNIVAQNGFVSTRNLLQILGSTPRIEFTDFNTRIEKDSTGLDVVAQNKLSLESGGDFDIVPGTGAGTQGQVLTKDATNNRVIWANAGPSADELVKISATDANSGYLEDKIEAGSNINFTKLISSGDEKIRISSPATTAGVLDTFFLTGDQVTTTAGTFYLTSNVDKGSVSLITQTVTNNDNQKTFYSDDWLSIVVTGNPRKLKAGLYQGSLKVQVNSNQSDQKWGCEIYLTDNQGVPENSGLTGQPVGDLGVQILAEIDTGIIDINANNPTAVTLSGLLPDDYLIPVNKRLRLHYYAEKIGTAGALIDFDLFAGQDANSFINIASAIVADDVEFDNTTSGLSSQNVQDAIDEINSKNHNDINAVQSATNAPTGERYHLGQEQAERVQNLTFEYIGVWNSAVTYGFGQVVLLNNRRYISRVRNNFNNNPVSSPLDWADIGLDTQIERTVQSLVNPATLTPDASTTKQINANAQTQSLTINPPINPSDGLKVIYRIRASATSALTWSASFVDLRGTLPTSAPINKTIYVGVIYDLFVGSWEVVSVVEQA